MALSARRVATAPPGRHMDEKGLSLLVKPSGARSWVLRYQLNGKRRDMGLGPFPEVSLAAAREKALAIRRQLLVGMDPLERALDHSRSFRDLAEELIENRRPGWRNAKHAAQWSSTLRTYAYPFIGDVDIRHIETNRIVTVLQSIWTVKPETASRVRQRIEAVLDYAAAIGLRDGANPARWRGHLDNVLPKPSAVRQVRHHPAMDWREAADFMAKLAQRQGVPARALKFLVLAAARSGEVRGTRWAEIDVANAVWTIPAERMKAAKEHRVPLSDYATQLLGSPGDPNGLVFANQHSPERPLSDMALTALLRNMGYGDITVHGFRSTFRDWSGETTNHPREVIEAALAHRLKDKAEAAYARGDLFEKRRRLMNAWASYLTGEISESP